MQGNYIERPGPHSNPNGILVSKLLQAEVMTSEGYTSMYEGVCRGCKTPLARRAINA